MISHPHNHEVINVMIPVSESHCGTQGVSLKIVLMRRLEKSDFLGSSGYLDQKNIK